MRTLRLTLPLSLQPSLNEWRRWHWSKRHEHQVMTAQAVQIALYATRWRPPPMDRARVTYRYYWPTARRRDPDNAMPKFLSDALVRCGVLVDDDFAHITLAIEQGGVDKQTPRIEVLIEELPQEVTA